MNLNLLAPIIGGAVATIIIYRSKLSSLSSEAKTKFRRNLLAFSAVMLVLHVTIILLINH